MLFNEYIEQVRADAIEELRGNKHYYDRNDDFIEELWDNDAVTGNGSGSYTFSTAKAWDNVAGSCWQECLLFDEDFLYELESLGETIDHLFKMGAEGIDVSARCFALWYIDWDEVRNEVWGDEEQED